MSSLQQNPKQIVIRILDIIAYKKNKDAYAEEFVSLCQQQTLINLLQSLSEHRKRQFQTDLDGKLDNAERLQKLLKEYFSESDIAKAGEKASEETFKNFLHSIIPTLNDDQKEKLNTYLQSLIQ